MGWLPVVPVIGLALGFALGFFIPVKVPAGLASYLSLAALAGLDSVLGGVRAGIEGKFHQDIFISGFLVNTSLAVALAYLGVLIGVELWLAAVVLLGGRVFLNLSLIRRYWLTQAASSKKKES
jgi:small basic protein